MTYEYKCTACAGHFDVYKSVKDLDRNETCPQCGEFGERQFVPQKVHFSGTKVQDAEYSPGLGAVVKNKYERSELAKRKGLVEIGNDYKTPDNIHKESDGILEAKRKKRWEED